MELYTINALDNDNFLVAGFDTNSDSQKHIFYSANISLTIVNWSAQMDALEDIFSNPTKARLYSYVNNAITKYVYTRQLTSKSYVCVFH